MSHAGARIVPNLDAAHIIIGIKEPPLTAFPTTPVPSPLDGNPVARTYMMFSHTAKGQSYNMPLLASFLSQNGADSSHLLPRLIDFELLTSFGKRTVGFGWYAGVAGVLESLASMAHSHLEQGVASPFLYTPRPHTLPSLTQLRSSLRAVGDRIASEGTPARLGPFVIGLTGSGNVAEGCLSILSELPIVPVHVKDLPNLVNNPDTDLHKIYLAHALPADYLTRQDDAAYDRDHYYGNPAAYDSTFHDSIAPYLTLFLNAVGWAPGFPRLMSNEQLPLALNKARQLYGPQQARFENIGDISCDPNGGLQFLTSSTTLSSPSAKFRPSTLTPDLPSVEIMAVDILPASIPLDASTHFSEKVFPYLKSLIRGYRAAPTDKTGVKDNEMELDHALERATIASEGALAAQHEWLDGPLGVWRSQTSAKEAQGTHGVLKKKKVLLLGSGMVAGPTVEEIAKRKDIELVIASNSATELRALAGSHTNVSSRQIDVSDQSVVSDLISQADVVISLLPVAFHTQVAEQCIQHQKHMVTASYISESMKALHTKALDASVLLLNEIGLDPGIDHCSAISLVERLKSQGKEIKSFISFCGGMPSPTVNDMGPLGYKFSWTPKGVLLATLNGARYRLKGKDVNVSGENLLRSYFPDLRVSNWMALEGIPNRDSMPYVDTYGLGGSARTVLRGTLRYPGYSDIVQTFKDLGLLEATTKVEGGLKSWNELIPRSQELRSQVHSDSVSTTGLSPYLQGVLAWLTESPLPPLPPVALAPIDYLTLLLSSKLQYDASKDERDMVVLAHEIITSSSRDPSAEEVHTSTLITHGTKTHSAMARTVGLPVAIAALQVVDGKVAMRGVVGPRDESVRTPVLTGLEKVGLGMVEKILLGGAGRSLESQLARQMKDI